MKARMSQRSLVAWQPEIFDRRDKEQAEALEQLFVQNIIWQSYDQMRAQLLDLVRCRNPQWQSYPANSPLITAKISETLQGHRPSEYGRWVYYPWSGKLVHLLNKQEFEELRLYRSRHKLTATDQSKLEVKTIGVVGLRAGNSTILALALEGIGGHFRLADHGYLDLVDMHQFRAGTYDIGLQKTKLCARQIYEINPYANVSLIDTGLAGAHLDRFINSPHPLDAVIDACDDCRLSAKLCESARALDIPVLRDNGSHPRPELHLAAAAIASTLRHLFLGNGITAKRQEPLLTKQTLETPRTPSRIEERTAPGSWPPTEGEAEAISELLVVLAKHAILAPSGGNTQPWHFYAQAKSLGIVHDQKRSESLIDEDQRGGHVALGAVIENMRLAALNRGFSITVSYFPSANLPLPKQHELVAQVTVNPENSEHKPTSNLDRLLYEQIPKRQTDREIYGQHPLNEETQQQLQRMAESAGCSLTLLQDKVSLEEIQTLAAEASHLRLLFDDEHREMMHEIRWSPHTTPVTSDGVDLENLDLCLNELQALAKVEHQRNVQTKSPPTTNKTPHRFNQNAITESSAIGLISVTGHSKQAQLKGGQAIQRLWLLATALGLAIHPMPSLIYMFNAKFSPRLNAQERSKLCGLCDRFDLLFPKESQDSQLMLFRISIGKTKQNFSLRRSVSEVLSPWPHTNPTPAEEL